MKFWGAVAEGLGAAMVTIPVYLFLLHYAGLKICLANLSVCVP